MYINKCLYKQNKFYYYIDKLGITSSFIYALVVEALLIETIHIMFKLRFDIFFSPKILCIPISISI